MADESFAGEAEVVGDLGLGDREGNASFSDGFALLSELLVGSLHSSLSFTLEGADTGNCCFFNGGSSTGASSFFAAFFGFTVVVSLGLSRGGLVPFLKAASLGGG